LDRQVFTQNLYLAKRRKILLLRIGLSLLFITLCTTMWLSKTKITPHAMLVYKTIAIAFFAALAYAFISMVQKMVRRLELHCPNCNRNLSGPMSHQVIESGQCFQCGMKLFE
jgi:hypothetical protein